MPEWVERSEKVNTWLQVWSSLWLPSGIVPRQKTRLLRGSKAGVPCVEGLTRPPPPSCIWILLWGYGCCSELKGRTHRHQETTAGRSARGQWTASFGVVHSLRVNYGLSKFPRQTVDETWARLMLGFFSSVFLTTNTSREEGAGLVLGGEKTVVKIRPYGIWMG